MSKERYGIIYKITNTINGKCYIGQTTKSFNRRYSYSGKGIERVYKHHKYYKEHNKNYNIVLLRSIEKYGFEAFTVDEEFDIAYSSEELDALEKKYIKEFNCIENGYNNTDGGTDGNFSEEIKIKMSKKRKGKYIGENHPQAKAVWCFELNKVFLCAKTADKEINLSEGSVAAVCRGVIKTAKTKNGYHYHFVWYDEYLNMTEYERMHYVENIENEKHKNRCIGHKNINQGSNHPKATEIICLKDSKIFNTIKECAAYYKISRNTITNICKHRQESTQTGLVFRYMDEYIQQNDIKTA